MLELAAISPAREPMERSNATDPAMVKEIFSKLTKLTKLTKLKGLRVMACSVVYVISIASRPVAVVNEMASLADSIHRRVASDVCDFITISFLVKSLINLGYVAIYAVSR